MSGEIKEPTPSLLSLVMGLLWFRTTQLEKIWLTLRWMEVGAMSEMA